MPDVAADKVLLVHRRRLTEKYGQGGTRRVVAALDLLIGADADRGIRAVRVDLSSTRSVKRYGATGVRDHSDAAAMVEAVQAVAAAAEPDYVVLVGGPDVIPHVAVRNPLAGTADPDPDVPSDLPYAISGGFTDDPARLVAPSRVVGRIPDVPGAVEPTVLLQLLRAQRGWIPFAAGRYRSHLTVSALTWKASTEESADRLFGSPDIRVSPPDGPAWTDDEAGRPTHFLNLHGATLDPRFFGEDHSRAFPVAHEPEHLVERIARGTLCTAECCYGAELFDPTLAGAVLPMAFAYLASGAYAYVGSTTTSYGPPVGNGAADLLCRYFLEEVLGGASTGRAFLQARQRFVRDQPVLRPVDAKTLVQFVLLGDPSIHPVVRVGDLRAPVGDVPDPGGDVDKVARIASRLLEPGRHDRRRNLEAAAWALARTTVVATDPHQPGPDLVAKVAATAGIPAAGASTAREFSVSQPRAVRGLADANTRVVVVVTPQRAAGRPPRRPARPRPRRTLARSPQPVDLVVVTATLRDGEVVAWTTAVSR